MWRGRWEEMDWGAMLERDLSKMVRVKGEGLTARDGSGSRW